MSMTVTVTRNVAPRIRGFLASSMLEVGPGVYCGVRLSKAVRERIWEVLQAWFEPDGNSSIVMVWQDGGAVAGMKVATLGVPPVEIVDWDGLFVTYRT